MIQTTAVFQLSARLEQIKCNPSPFSLQMHLSLSGMGSSTYTHSDVHTSMVKRDKNTTGYKGATLVEVNHILLGQANSCDFVKVPLDVNMLNCSTSEHSQPAVTAAGDHVANLRPGVQVRVVDLH